MRPLLLLPLLLAASACVDTGDNNSANNGFNEVAEEGLEQATNGLGGDEIDPHLEGEDDAARNQIQGGNAAMPANNAAAPLPAGPGPS